MRPSPPCPSHRRCLHLLWSRREPTRHRAWWAVGLGRHELAQHAAAAPPWDCGAARLVRPRRRVSGLGVARRIHLRDGKLRRHRLVGCRAARCPCHQPLRLAADNGARRGARARRIDPTSFAVAWPSADGDLRSPCQSTLPACVGAALPCPGAGRRSTLGAGPPRLVGRLAHRQHPRVAREGAVVTRRESAKLRPA